MGLKVNAREAARLAHRTERTVRAWVAGGKLKAEPQGPRGRGRGVGPSRWLIDTDELARMPGVTLDRARLAQLELRAHEAELSTSLVERVSQLEEGLRALRERVSALETQAREHRDEA